MKRLSIRKQMKQQTQQTAEQTLISISLRVEYEYAREA